MPNKYSHATVLSNYESYGLIDFDRSRPSKPASVASKSTASSTRSRVQSSPSAHHVSIGDSKQRIRLGSPPRPRSKPIPPPLHRKSSSVETQIYAPQHSPTPPPTRACNDTPIIKRQGHISEHRAPSEDLFSHSQKPSNIKKAYGFDDRYAPRCSPSQPLTQGRKEAACSKPQESTIQYASPSQQSADQRDGTSTETRDLASQPLVPMEQVPRWDHSSALIIGGQSYATSKPIRASAMRRNKESQAKKGSPASLRIPHNRYGRVPIDARAFTPERPPSPPATPESDRSFTLETPIEKPDPITSPPPIPERSARRSPPALSPEAQSPTRSVSNLWVEQSRPKISPAQSTPRSPTSAAFSITTRTPSLLSTSKSPTATTFSITTRTSSLNAATSRPPISKTLSMPSEPFFGDGPELTDLPKTVDASSQAFAIDDADLESLPSTYVPSSPDFNIQPWSDDSIGPAIFRAGELNIGPSSIVGPASTRASSFDSAAPPPISMNRRLPPVVTEMTSSNTPRIPKTHKRSKPSLASLAFFRSAPKAILYSQTTPGKPPVPVSVSRTAVPSIPALFPGYKGSFPPPQRNDERSRRASRDANTPKQVRGRSVPAKGSEKRRSWFKADPLERPFGLWQPASESDSEQVLRNIRGMGLE